MGYACAAGYGPRARCPARNDVHHSSAGIAAVKSACRSLHDLDTVHVVHVQPREIDVIHRLAGKPLAVNQEEDALTSLTVEIQVRLLVHGICELQPGHLLLQQILDIGGIRAADLGRRNEPRLHWRVLQKFRHARTGHHQFAEVVRRQSERIRRADSVDGGHARRFRRELRAVAGNRRADKHQRRRYSDSIAHDFNVFGLFRVDIGN